MRVAAAAVAAAVVVGVWGRRGGAEGWREIIACWCICVAGGRVGGWAGRRGGGEGWGVGGGA